MNPKPAPFSTDPEAIEELLNCDYSSKITLDMAKKSQNDRKVRIYCDGVYDLFHQGHARQFLQAKNAFPNTQTYLIVGVCSDAVTHAKKGRTVMTDTERYEAVRHCRYVDEVLPDAPWKITQDFLKMHKIDFVAQDSTPYISDDDDVYKEVKELDMFVSTQRTEGISTSDIITRIMKNYDVYIKRNFSRGYTARELNVPYLIAMKFFLESIVSGIKVGMLNRWNTVMSSIYRSSSQEIATSRGIDVTNEFLLKDIQCCGDQ